MIETGFSIWSMVKLFYLVGFLLYLVFAAFVVRQVYQMTNTLSVGFEFQLRMIAWIHLGLAISIFLLALVSL